VRTFFSARGALVDAAAAGPTEAAMRTWAEGAACVGGGADSSVERTFEGIESRVER
jgi:hypothetical protein